MMRLIQAEWRVLVRRDKVQRKLDRLDQLKAAPTMRGAARPPSSTRTEGHVGLFDTTSSTGVEEANNSVGPELVSSTCPPQSTLVRASRKTDRIFLPDNAVTWAASR